MNCVVPVETREWTIDGDIFNITNTVSSSRCFLCVLTLIKTISYTLPLLDSEYYVANLHAE